MYQSEFGNLFCNLWPREDPINMKRFNYLVLVPLALIYLGLWVYQVGYEHARADLANEFEKSNHELIKKIVRYERQVQNLKLISTNP